MKHFNTKEEIIKELEKTLVYKAEKEFIKSCKDLQEILETCSLDFRLWGIQKGYLQFAEHCNWDKLNGNDWAELLIYQPQFSDKCNWEKLKGSDWVYLLIDQPQFAEKCDWNKLNKYDWDYLLEYHPQFAKY